MGDRARILATEALDEARSALIQFAETVDRALVGVDADINRMSQWLQHERPAHWKREVRARETAVANARSAIARKQIIAAPEPASVVDERRALQRAKARLDEAVKRQQATHRWGVTWDRTSIAYKGAAHQVREMVGARIPQAVASIAAMIQSVEAYLGTQAPPPGAGEPGTGAPTADAPPENAT